MELFAVVSGKKFNELYKDTKFVKLTNGPEIHNGFQFVDGLNIDTVEFNPTSQCCAGGIYFCVKDMTEHWRRNLASIFFIRDVTIPDDAQVYCESEKFKADKIILSRRRLFYHSFDDFFMNHIVTVDIRDGIDCLLYKFGYEHLLSHYESELLYICTLENFEHQSISDIRDRLKLMRQFYPSVYHLVVKILRENGKSKKEIREFMREYNYQWRHR